MSETGVSSGGMGTVEITQGEWAGWTVWVGDPFEDRAGPFYAKELDDGSKVCAFRAEQRHMNGAGFLHGGCLMTFADSTIFYIAQNELRGYMGVTLHMSTDFLEPAQAGDLIEARGEIVRGGGKTIFLQGMITADDRPILRFDAIIRKVRKDS